MSDKKTDPSDTMPLPQETAKKDPPNNPQDSGSVEEYLFGRSVLKEGAKNLAWSDTTNGRIGIRLISRGIFGAAAFAIGGRYANNALQGYEPTDFRWSKDWKKPLHVVAKGFDTVFGKPIEWGVRAIGGSKADDWAFSATRFRTRAYFYKDKPGYMPGRSLGAEMVSVSFDFASASMADSAVRNIVQAFDPNIQKPWEKDGKFDAGEWLKAVGRASWRITTKNAGEDWAVALPYAYFMKWQRQAVSRMFDGSKLFLDHGNNGGSLLIDKLGKVKSDYQLAGALDLQGRFVVYNWFTLMYRDFYDAMGANFKKWQQNDYRLDMDKNDRPVESVLGAIGQSLRYTAKSFIKANLYMQPAVPFFWAFRTPQSKWRSSPIQPENPDGYGVVTSQPIATELKDARGKVYHPLHDGDLDSKYRRWDSARNRVFQAGTHTNKVAEGAEVFLGGKAYTAPDFNPYALKNQVTLFGALLNPLGALSYHTGSWFNHHLNPLVTKSKTLTKLMGDTVLHREMTLRSFVDASFSYTPYMIAKAEFGLRVDDRPVGGGLGEMDKAIYGLIDNVATFRFKKSGESLKRIADLVLDVPNKDAKMREADADATRGIGDGSLVPVRIKKPATRVEKSSIVEQHKQALTGAPERKDWKGFIADKREAAQIMPDHPTVQ
ncbi:MAG: hypothetical protein ACOYJ2_08155 [Rickettsiales bacterium]